MSWQCTGQQSIPARIGRARSSSARPRARPAAHQCRQAVGRPRRTLPKACVSMTPLLCQSPVPQPNPNEPDSQPQPLASRHAMTIKLYDYTRISRQEPTYYVQSLWRSVALALRIRVLLLLLLLPPPALLLVAPRILLHVNLKSAADFVIDSYISRV